MPAANLNNGVYNYWQSCLALFYFFTGPVISQCFRRIKVTAGCPVNQWPAKQARVMQIHSPGSSNGQEEEITGMKTKNEVIKTKINVLSTWILRWIWTH